MPKTGQFGSDTFLYFGIFVFLEVVPEKAGSERTEHLCEHHRVLSLELKDGKNTYQLVSFTVYITCSPTILFLRFLKLRISPMPSSLDQQLFPVVVSAI